MAMTLAAKAALCVCPTVLMGTAAVSIPKARKAIHKATASRGKPVKSNANARRAKAPQTAALDLPCQPAFAGLAPPLVNVGLPIVDTSGLSNGEGFSSSGGGQFFGGGGGGGGVGGGLFVAGGGGGGGSGGSGSLPDGGVTPPGDNPMPPVASAVAEPGTWMLMVGGFAVAGGALRLRRRRTLLASAHPASISSRSVRWHTKSGAVVAAVAPESFGMAAVSGNAATLAKVAMCVCPPVFLFGTVATVPAARQAVHAVTGPAIKSADLYANYTPAPLVPCLPVVQTAQTPTAVSAPVMAIRDLDRASLSI